MRVTNGGLAAATMLAALALGGCGKDPEHKMAQADHQAAAAGFTPPSVTSRLDFGGMMERRFHALDRDGDGVIDRTEMPRNNSRLLELDRNHDGKITATEFSEGMLARFDRMDLNRDGTVTSEERETYRRNPQPAPTPTGSVIPVP
ncbi:hypothetical protein QE361_002474 [Sphingomonas sp. SORGH_AS802]|jgi:hypothetical protein|uniref:EF-hand domain-containing protein n=2 Tax=unclassified Sphingomonas TaxID=196159 RepID=UPI0028618909|nr:hypothetical protein [Sphingomonas sp. SORGH_AS_0802]MDR6128317.1 hypothetical protein [Sphingomonas sp. SORGH_AS_0438]MDR6135479.1 hypothetical protein [Sphingomonas sp. SORGH_AS_0802]